MENKLEMLNQYVNYSKEIKNLTETRRLLGVDLAPLIAPWKIGDVIKVRGWNHKGKMGKVYAMGMKIEFDAVYLWTEVNVLKKNGSVSTYKSSFDSAIRIDGTIRSNEEYFGEMPQIPIKITDEML